MDNITSLKLMFLVFAEFFTPFVLWCVFDGIKNRRAKK